MGFQEDAKSLSSFEEIYDATFEEISGASLVAQVVKSLPAMRETWVRSLDREDPLEKEMSTRSSIPAWEITWTEEAGVL